MWWELWDYLSGGTQRRAHLDALRRKTQHTVGTSWETMRAAQRGELRIYGDDPQRRLLRQLAGIQDQTPGAVAG